MIAHSKMVNWAAGLDHRFAFMLKMSTFNNAGVLGIDSLLCDTIFPAYFIQHDRICPQKSYEMTLLRHFSLTMHRNVNIMLLASNYRVFFKL